MAGPGADKNTKLFEKYLSDKRILIADGNASSRAGLARTIISMGAKTQLVALVASFDHAVSEIEKNRPHVVICDYELGSRCGIELLQSQREQRPESRDSLFVLVTGNTSQSAVAQAAEEDVDTYILKPYTIDVLRNSIMRAAISKLYPSEYMKVIEEGKKLLFQGKADEAIAKFDHATSLDSKPSLACFYKAQAELLKKAIEEAQGDYSKGLGFNKIHYKCLVGLFELLMSKKQYNEAYDIVKKLSRYFPANPQRLNSVVRLAIVTKSYDDIERYYQIFTNLDTRNEELVRCICAALVVCGKFYLQSNSNSRALELFQKAGATAGGRTRILREIIIALTESDQTKVAGDFLKRFPPDSYSGLDYLVSEYLVIEQTQPVTKTVSHGRKLIAGGGAEDPLIYKILIRSSVAGGYSEPATELAETAGRKWPDQRAEFARLLTAKKDQKSA